MNKQSQILRATAVLKEAKAHDVIDKPIPEDDGLKIKVADAIIKQAERARKAGENGDHINAILFTAEVDWSDDPDPERQGPTKDDPDEKKYLEAIRESIQDNLPIPQKIEKDVPELPLDLTSLSDKKLRFFHGFYHACFARAVWLYSINAAGEAAAKEIADHYEDKYLISADRKDVGGKPKTAAVLKAEAADQNPAIIKWREKQKKHAIEANRFRRMRDIYEGRVEVLSREGTLRENERKHS